MVGRGEGVKADRRLLCARGSWGVRGATACPRSDRELLPTCPDMGQTCWRGIVSIPWVRMGCVGAGRDARCPHNPKVACSNAAPATIDDEGLADVQAASPFRLPRLHPGIGSGHFAERLAVRGESHQKSLATSAGVIVQCGAWRWANARASKLRCWWPPPSCRSRRAIRSTRS